MSANPQPAPGQPGSNAMLRLQRGDPQLVGVVTAGERLGLAPGELLHAGPPLRDPTRPPPVLRAALRVTSVHKGWARDAADADAQLAAGRLRLSPAQDRGCVTPLAALVSAGTPMFEVRDASLADAAPVLAPVSPALGPDTRFGNENPALPARLRDRDTRVAPAWRQLLAERGPIALWPAAQAGMLDGDDLHNRCSGATGALVAGLPASVGAQLLADLAATPLFFLTLWMAACASLLRSAEAAGDWPTLVTRAGGNGEEFGIALAGAPGCWVVTPAGPPRGPLLAGVDAGTPIAGAIGDSALIDLIGFGAQRLSLATEPLAALQAFLPADHASRAARLMALNHPRVLPASPLGLDARRVLEAGVSPLVTLAMLAADGRRGLAGRGLYEPPPGLFRAALDV